MGCLCLNINLMRIRKIISGGIECLRKLIGVSKVLWKADYQIRELKLLSQKVDSALSRLDYVEMDLSRAKSTVTFKQFQALVRLLYPADIQGKHYVRIGRDHDGGYILLDDFDEAGEKVAYSFGINDDVSWDEGMGNLGFQVFMYDHTISKLPRSHPNFHFFKQGVCGASYVQDCATLEQVVTQNGHANARDLVLKMDIEGHEWEVLRDCPTQILSQFSQIAIEWHGLNPDMAEEEFEKVCFVLEKLNSTHQVVHVHANGFCPASWILGMALPHVLEVTYVRRSSHVGRFVKNTRTFPTILDQPTYPWLPDVPLKAFSAGGDEVDVPNP